MSAECATHRQDRSPSMDPQPGSLHPHLVFATNGLDRDFAHRPFDDSIEEPQLASMLPSLANWTLGMDR